MTESQYTELYLDTTADPATRWTPGTYLTYTLHGRAKSYSAHYLRALMRAIARRVENGTVIEMRSKHGGSAYVRTATAVAQYREKRDQIRKTPAARKVLT
jgi:predicted alpha/beta-fold hydrolase